MIALTIPHRSSSRARPADRNDGFGTAFAQVQARTYDPETDTITDLATDTVYTEQGGYFTDADGSQLLPGWRTSVGLDNYERLFTDQRTRESFIRVFVWTVVFALGWGVSCRSALGLSLALVFNDAPNERPQDLSQPDHHPVRDSELHDRARVEGDAQPAVRGDQPLARHQPAPGWTAIGSPSLDPARQPLAGLPVHVLGEHRSAAGIPEDLTRQPGWTVPATSNVSG